MRVLMIADTAPPLYGGAGTQAALLAEHLREAGHDVTLLARQKARVRGTSPGTVFTRPFVRNQRLSIALHAVSAGWRVLTSKVDVVHCHGAYGYSWTAIAVARLRGIPSVVKVTLVGSDDPASVRARRFGPIPTGRWMSGLFRSANRVIVMNEHLAEVVKSAEPRAHVEVLPNGVEWPAEPSVGEDEPRLAFVGILSRRKGIDTLMRAWPTFRQAHPGARLTLIGPPGDVPVTTASEAGISATGLLNPGEARRILGRANLFALPSRQEGQPNSLVEAMSFGIPSVASDIPENRATGRDAVLYFPAGDPEALANALERAWADRARLGLRARAEAAQFDIDRVAERCSTLYEELHRARRKEG